METVTKKTISVEFQGKKYSLQDDSTIDDLLAYLGLPKGKPVRLESRNDCFVLILQ
jgi:sulfur carrier protein ThiS